MGSGLHWGRDTLWGVGIATSVLGGKKRPEIQLCQEVPIAKGHPGLIPMLLLVT